MLTRRRYRDETDYWQIRNFLRETFLANGRLEHSWHVARLDHWRWHLIDNCAICAPVAQVTHIWEADGKGVVAALHRVTGSEIRLHIHPDWRTADLEDEMLAVAESRLGWDDSGQQRLHLAVDVDDDRRQAVLTERGYKLQSGTSHKWWRDLMTSLPETAVPPGYTVRAMGGNEQAARSWASWRSFHSDEPDGNYDGDWSWVDHFQKMPLYRRDLDIVAVAPGGEMAAFATIAYDDYTRSAVCVLVGTAVEHQQRGLGKAVLLEGLRRLQQLGGTRVFATAYDPPADGLYGSVMETHIVARTWRRVF